MMKAKQKSYKESDPLDPLEPINFKSIGSKNDPCFGKLYDLTTQECKICGDSELCCSVFARNQGKTRKELEKENSFKDIETLIDKTAVRKTIRYMVRKGKAKKEILEAIQSKYETSREDARALYREYLSKSTKEE